MLKSLVAAATAATGGAGLYSWRVEPVWPEVTYQRMALPDLGAEFVGARIIQLSDLHAGRGVPTDYLQSWADWVSNQQADWVVVTGDCIQGGWSSHAVAARLLGSLRASERVLVTLGNHDWATSSPGGGISAVARDVSAAIEAHGAQVLRNQAVTFRRGRAELHVVGLDDLWGDRFDPDAAFAGVGSSAPTVVLSHNPDTVTTLRGRRWDWMLAGHTHGGQVSLPLIGPPLLPLKNKQFVAGLYPLGSKNLYVNRGLGWLHRVRFNARPEVTVFTLEKL